MIPDKGTNKCGWIHNTRPTSLADRGGGGGGVYNMFSSLAIMRAYEPQ